MMLCAHMDEVGVIVTDVTEKGYLKFACAGGVGQESAHRKKTVFLLGRTHVPGVIGHRAVHLVRKEEKENVPQAEELYIDIGAAGREEALGLIDLGDSGMFDDTVYEFVEGFSEGQGHRRSDRLLSAHQAH